MELRHLDETRGASVGLPGSRRHHGWAKNGRPITEQDLQAELRRSIPTLQALDQITTDTRTRTWDADPSARTPLTRATTLAALWG